MRPYAIAAKYISAPPEMGRVARHDTCYHSTPHFSRAVPPEEQCIHARHGIALWACRARAAYREEIKRRYYTTSSFSATSSRRNIIPEAARCAALAESRAAQLVGRQHTLEEARRMQEAEPRLGKYIAEDAL